MSTTPDRQLSEREIKALQIAAKSRLTRKGNVWTVPSQAGHGEYEVNPDPETPRCTPAALFTLHVATSCIVRRGTFPRP